MVNNMNLFTDEELQVFAGWCWGVMPKYRDTVDYNDYLRRTFDTFSGQLNTKEQVRLSNYWVVAKNHLDINEYERTHYLLVSVSAAIAEEQERRARHERAP